MFDFRAENSDSAETLRIAPGRLLLLLAYLALALGPLFFAAFYLLKTEPSAGRVFAGRVGLILPAILLSDDVARSMLWRGFWGTGLCITAATVCGVWFGLLATRAKSSLSKGLLRVLMLPGMVPAWLFPMIWGLSVGEASRLSGLFSLGLSLWLVWIAWWGALRLAGAILEKSDEVGSGEWDAARLLGAGAFQKFRWIVKPRVLSDFRQELKLVAAASVFDPTPVLFWGVPGWPMAELLAALREPGGHGLVRAATWAFWMLAILVIWFRLISMATRSSHAALTERIAPAIESNSSKTLFQKGFSVTDRFALVLGFWPWIMLLAGFRPLSVLGQGGWSALVDSVAISELFLVRAWLGGIGFGVLFAVIAGLLLIRLKALVHWELRAQQARWPVSLGVASIVACVQLAGKSAQSASSVINASWLIWFVGVATVVLIALGQASITACGCKDNLQKALAARDAALLMGASPSRARRLSGQASETGLGLGLVLKLFSGFWWVWAAPAWAMAGLVGSGSLTTWGAWPAAPLMLEPRNIAICWLLTVVPQVFVWFLRIFTRPARDSAA